MLWPGFFSCNVMNTEHTESWMQKNGSPSPEKLSLYTLWDLLLSGTTSLSFCHPSPSLSLWPGVNLSFLLPADSCAWQSGSLFMRSLHLSPAAASVTPLPSPPFFLPSLPLSKWKQIIYGGVSSAHCYLSGTSGLHLAQGKHWSTHTCDLSVTTQTLSATKCAGFECFSHTAWQLPFT